MPSKRCGTWREGHCHSEDHTWLVCPHPSEKGRGLNPRQESYCKAVNDRSRQVSSYSHRTDLAARFVRRDREGRLFSFPFLCFLFRFPLFFPFCCFFIFGMARRRVETVKRSGSRSSRAGELKCRIRRARCSTGTHENRIKDVVLNCKSCVTPTK